jgi:hypothetical protein
MTTSPHVPGTSRRPAETVSSDSAEVGRVLAVLRHFGPVLAIKLYRAAPHPRPVVPVLPCLDHEAMLHARVPPHAAVYVQDSDTADLHELVFIPARRRIDVDTVSTWGESSPESHARLLSVLASRYPEYRVRVRRPSRWRGERRVAEACHAQVSLRDVLLGDDMGAVKAAIDRLQVIGALMEKQSRVASWGVRTVTGPLLAAAGVLTFLGLATMSGALGEPGVTALRYTLVGLLGASFLYYGLKAVQLTDMANRVWKRAAEYGLILAERRRLLDAAPPGAIPSASTDSVPRPTAMGNERYRARHNPGPDR